MSRAFDHRARGDEFGRFPDDLEMRQRLAVARLQTARDMVEFHEKPPGSTTSSLKTGPEATVSGRP